MQDTNLTGHSWDDLRIVLAISRGGSLSGAAQRLGVNHSTVFRRLKTLEGRLDVRLFDRRAEGYRPTSAGAELCQAAERVEAEMLALERRLSGQDARLSGNVRLTAPDDMAELLLMPLLADCAARYPEIRLELAIENRMLSLTRREADIALRPSLEPPETLVGRRVAPLGSALYGAAGMAPPSDDPGALGQARWIAWEEGGGPAATARWLAREVSVERVLYRSNSLLNQASACRAGLGLALLPCFLGDAAPELARVLGPRPEWSSELWLLTHPDLRHTARIRAIMDFLFGGLKGLRPRLAGGVS